MGSSDSADEELPPESELLASEEMNDMNIHSFEDPSVGDPIVSPLIKLILFLDLYENAWRHREDRRATEHGVSHVRPNDRERNDLGLRGRNRGSKL